MADVRIERDTFGEIEVPADHLWGAQTQRSLLHFDISTEKMPRELIHALALVKRCAALVNRELGSLDAKKADAIVAASDEVLEGPLRLGTPQPRRRHLDLAEGVALDPDAFRHGLLLYALAETKP